MTNTIDRKALSWLSPGTQLVLRWPTGNEFVWTVMHRDGPHVWLMRSECRRMPMEEMVPIVQVAEWLREGYMAVMETTEYRIYGD